ncbi:MAG: type II toxin-antitoxin system RelE/ParE family toxin [Chloroflexota bacterium]|nr:type II toxin-antitoxin system RelE/ParE family toxin [Chloroflexota bacterium]MDE2968496.1 type II toxin-antitoxin system RelE/ParE family toxin [Chloroflexota bacterium]
MPDYSVIIRPRAERSLSRLSRADFIRIDERIVALAANPRPHGVTKIRDDLHRIRVGAWRIIYFIEDEERIVSIERVERREKDTYRSL